MTDVHDLLIIGAGISGLIHLREAARGGLWRDLTMTLGEDQAFPMPAFA